MLAAGDGHFNEALVGLESARSAFDAAGDGVERVQTELKIANVYEWLGDYERALSVLATAHAAVAPLLGEEPPSGAEVSALIREQFEAIAKGASSTAGTDAMRLRQIGYEVIQAQARDNRSLGAYDVAEKLFRRRAPSSSSWVCQQASTSTWR